MGTVESKEAEIESLLLEWDVPYRPFSRAILDCLPEEGESWKVPSKDSKVWEGREDLRDLVICSIDPIGKTSFFVKIRADLSWDQVVKISMMRFMRSDCPMGTLRLVFVSATPRSGRSS